MNKSYRSIFNEQTATWVAVSEIEGSKGKRSKSGQTMKDVSGVLSGAVIAMGAVASINAAQAQVAINVTPASLNTGGIPAYAAVSSAIAIGLGATAAWIWA